MKLAFMDQRSAVGVAELEKRCFSTPWSLNSILGELDNPCALWLTATEGETLCGYLGVQYGPDGADIMNIAVDSAYRNRGIAQQLMKSMAERLREKQLSWLTLEVRESNLPAISLYRKLGFREVGVRRHYYRNPVENALLMTLFFNETEGDTLC